MVKNVGIILAAGYGSRYHSIIPKQFTEICGREVISYSIDEFRSSKNMDVFVVLLSREEYESRSVEKQYGVETVAGGASRAESFFNALIHIQEHYPDCEKILFHEAARPLVKAETFDLYFELLDEYDYVMSCKTITDSLGTYLSYIPKREDYFLIQAPEAYKYSMLLEHFNVKSDIYFAAYQLPQEAKGYMYFGIKHNLKLTYPEDREMIEFFLK